MKIETSVCAVVLPVLLAACATGPVTQARTGKAPGVIDRLEITSTAAAFGGAIPPNAAGPYKIITGIVHGRLLPSAPENAGIVDLGNAQPDADGYVAYTTDFVILRPAEAAHARRIMLYEVVNRGTKLSLPTLLGVNTLRARPPAASFPSLLQQGYAIVWSGWQGGIAQSGNGAAGPVGVRFPTATLPGGAPVTGLAREEFVPDGQVGKGSSFRLTYPPASLSDRSEVVFTARATWNNAQGLQDYDAPSSPVADWRYVANADGSVGVAFTPPPQVPGPQGPTAPDAGTIYSFVYRARDPVVNGIGFAAVRDLVAFLRYTDRDGSGNANPLADLKQAPCAIATHCPDTAEANVDIVIAQGTSQSGRFLRDFLYQGFNRDTAGRKVFDGLVPVIAGGRRTWTNLRFSQIGRWSKQHEDHFMPGDQFPFAYNILRDPLTGVSDGLLKKCLASDTCPKIMQIDGSYEWWGGRASLVVTDGAGRDVDLPDNVRYYMVPGTQHGGGYGVTTGAYTLPKKSSQCQLPNSPVALNPVLRAMVPAMERWLLSATTPPASRHPTASDGTAVVPERVTFPRLANAILPSGAEGVPTPLSLAYTGVHNQLFVTDYARAEPKVDLTARYVLLVPQVDRNGNEQAGVRVPDVQVPLATYTGWNVRGQGHAEGEACAASGAAIPFAIHASDKTPGTDTRAALSDLYLGRADYQAKVGAAARQLREQGYLLPYDENLYGESAKKVSPRLLPTP